VKALLVAVVFSVFPFTAFAGPPTIGVSYDFADPVYGSVVLCDNAEQVKAIASAEDPHLMFLDLFETVNERGEPFCVSGVFSAPVVAVEQLPNMVDRGDTFAAWSVEIEAPAGEHYWALYLELLPPQVGA
jgi:hypothetical protein